MAEVDIRNKFLNSVLGFQNCDNVN